MAHVQLSLHDLSRLVVLQTQSGKSREEIVRVLVARGWPEVSAVRFVDMTLTEEAVRAQVPEEERQPGEQAFSVSQAAWRVLLIIVLITMVFIACMISAYAR